MLKEVALKKIELKVSANCCEGCKKKVKKALRNIEGVLKTNINPLQPKITVLGNVNPHILIRKLLKVGKRAELCSYVEGKDEKKEEIKAVSKERDIKKQDSEFKQEKHTDECDIKIEKTKDVTEGGVGNKNKGSKDKIENAFDPQEMKKDDTLLLHPQVNFIVHPSMQPYSNIKTHPQYCYIAQPCTVAVPYYAIPSYPTPYSACVKDCYHFDRTRYWPSFLRPTVRVGDDFSDENTIGCHVM